MNGYITYVNENPKYKSLSNILIESILSFSKYNIQVFTINHDGYHSSQRVNHVRVNLKKSTFFDICNVKPLAAIECMFDLGIILDSDVIITKQTDNLFFENAEKSLDFPLAPLHPQDVIIDKNFMNLLSVTQKTQHYVHADTYVFTNKSKEFLQECYDIGTSLADQNIIPPVVDETIFNALLWKHGQTNAYLDVYDPYYECFMNFNPSYLASHGYNISNTIHRYICHGCKDVSIAENIYQTILDEVS